MPLLWEGDWLGTVFMAIGLGSLIAFLEEGQNDDWFTSTFIQRCFTLAVKIDDRSFADELAD